MKITYIHHSCFVVELEDCIFVFDYYKGELPEFDKDKRIIFFVSHAHGDHFNPAIYQYAEYNPYVTYVVSDDVRQSLSFAVRLGTGGENTIFVDNDKLLYLNVDNRGVSKKDPGFHDIKIETLKSTDEGVAFIIEYAGKNDLFCPEICIGGHGREKAKKIESAEKKSISMK